MHLGGDLERGAFEQECDDISNAHATSPVSATTILLISANCSLWKVTKTFKPQNLYDHPTVFWNWINNKRFCSIWDWSQVANLVGWRSWLGAGQYHRLQFKRWRRLLVTRGCDPWELVETNKHIRFSKFLKLSWNFLGKNSVLHIVWTLWHVWELESYVLSRFEPHTTFGDPPNI